MKYDGLGGKVEGKRKRLSEPEGESIWEKYMKKFATITNEYELFSKRLVFFRRVNKNGNCITEATTLIFT